MSTSPGSDAATPDFDEADWLRLCRDLAWSEIAAMPGISGRLGPRISPSGCAPLDWSMDGLNLDSLARMQLATAAATWCNAYDSGFEDLFLAKRSVADWAVAMRRAREAGARHFTFSTSGSTGTRKHIRHREDLLAGEAVAWQSVLQAEAPACPVRRVVVLAPTHHIYGFIWGVLLPQVLGVPALDADLAALPAFDAGDLIVAVPDQWAWLAGGARAWPAGVLGVSSTAPLPAAVHRQLTSAQPQPAPDRLVRLLQIYGSSETAGLAYRSTPDAPYRLAPGRLRSVAGGIALQLADGTLAEMAVQDELDWATDSAFELRGRFDASVQVGGHNVSPEWVRQQLLAHPAVREASVRLSSTRTPPRLKAFVVLETDVNAAAAVQQTQFECWLADQLPWYAAPAKIDYGTELPRTAMGKASDWPER